MDTETHRRQDQSEDKIEEHSLPGTNQAGKGPADCEKDGSDKPEDEASKKK